MSDIVGIVVRAIGDLFSGLASSAGVLVRAIPDGFAFAPPFVLAAISGFLAILFIDNQIGEEED